MEKNEIEKHFKGTTTVGIICSDGVVIGADTRATMGDFIASPEVRKVHRIDTNLALTIAGGVGDAQELIRILKAQNEIYKMNEGHSMVPKSANSLLSIILQANKMVPYYVQLIVAGMDGEEPQMYNLDPLGGYTEEKNFTVTGSGSEVAIGYLEDSFKKGTSTKDAVKIAARALAMAMKRNSATGDGMIIAAMTKSGYAEYTGKELEKALGAR
ncbi:MAG: proteasome subunit beta [Candidatus Micrarchaeaceae archaeon]|jgi:proteasome beta subunit|nr:proteasome subunit beta [Candidatus Micrarchaeota archaeon]HII09886.1 proteasome subunit beta [Candidatus Micrarchaeota archaeon]